MKFYRASFQTVIDAHIGYEFFGSKAEAVKAEATFIEERSGDEPSVTVDQIQVTPTRAGILAALNRFANHAENG